MRLPIAFALLAAACASRSELPGAVADPIARYAGRWIQRGPYSPIHRGADRILSIEPDADGWSISFASVHHPGVNRPELSLTFSAEAPVPLTWRDGALEFPERRLDDRVQRVTVDLRAGKLVFPALVRQDARTWECRGYSQGASFICEHDPLLVPAGSASHDEQHWVGQPARYETKETNAPFERGRRVTVIEFWQRRPDGGEELCAELFPDLGEAGAFVRMWGGSKVYSGQSWEPLSDEEWERLRALPPPARPGGGEDRARHGAIPRSSGLPSGSRRMGCQEPAPRVGSRPDPAHPPTGRRPR